MRWSWTRTRWIVLGAVVWALTTVAVAQPIMRVTAAFGTLAAGTNSLTTSAEALASTSVVRECMVQNDPDNTVDILVGDSSSQVIQLSPGQDLVIPIEDVATIFVKAVSGTPTANYLCR